MSFLTGPRLQRGPADPPPDGTRDGVFPAAGWRSPQPWPPGGPCGRLDRQRGVSRPPPHREPAIDVCGL